MKTRNTLYTISFCMLTMGGIWTTFGLDVNVTDAPYSALGNGTTNDRPAIQAAIDAVSTTGGGMVNIPGARTYLTGTLQIKSNVTIAIAANAELRSSMNTSHWAAGMEPLFGRRFSNSSFAWDDKYLYNYPLIWGDSGTHNVAVTGAGTIRIGEASGGDDNQIFMSAIGFFNVDHFTIRGISIRRSKGYNTQFHNCSYGRITHINISDPYTGSDFNCDGVSMAHSQYMRVDSCYLTSNDDLVYPATVYNDPRGRGRWLRIKPRPCLGLEIDYNTFVHTRVSDINVIDFGGRNPDLSQNEISGLYIHHNTFQNGGGFSPRDENTSILDGGPTAPWSPMKDWRIENNTGGSHSIPSGWIITNLYFPGYTAKKSPSSFQNAGFETRKIGYWSVRGSASAKNNAVGQSGSWYGAIENLDQGDVKIFQGLELAAGNYDFSAKIQTSGVTVQLFVAKGSDSSIVAAKDVNPSSWSTQTMHFCLSSAGLYRIGMQRGSASSGWARIDDAALAVSGTGCSSSIGVAVQNAESVRTPLSITRSAGVLVIRALSDSPFRLEIFSSAGERLFYATGSGTCTYTFAEPRIASIAFVRMQSKGKVRITRLTTCAIK